MIQNCVGSMLGNPKPSEPFDVFFRQLMAGLVQKLGGNWKYHLNFAADISRNLVEDMLALHASASDPPVVGQGITVCEMPIEKIKTFNLLTGGDAA